MACFARRASGTLAPMMTWSRGLYRGLGVALVTTLLAGAAVGCATYRDDLDRAVGHYNGRQYDRSLALLEVLESDIDSLSEAERAQYAYYRGMSHYLLDQRLDARHWLGRAAAREKKNEGSLQPDEKKKVDDTLADLNKARYGGAETPAESDDACSKDEDCGDGSFCDNSTCRATDGAKTGGSKAEESTDAKDDGEKADEAKADDAAK